MYRKGVTLIELLIVILVIGILSAAFTFSFSEMSATAHASNIINNLHHVKAAVITWHMNNREKVRPNGYIIIDNKGNDDKFAKVIHAVDIMPYLDGNFEAENKDIRDSSGCIYFTNDIENQDKSLRWRVGCRIDNPKLKEKLESRNVHFDSGNVYMDVLNFSKGAD